MTVTRLPGFVAREHVFTLPIDHARPQDGTLEVFAREVRAAGKEHADLPWLVFLQGGPGHGSPRLPGPAWIARAAQDFVVLLLDQRGTGRSSPLLAQTLARLGDVDAQARVLRHFRADAIVRDCETIRTRFLGERPWTVLGQSFGGFCAVHYLSAAPQGLAAALITGGLPPLDASAEEVYERTADRMVAKNAAYFARYPGDRETFDRLVRVARAEHVRLPDGDRLTVGRLRQLGFPFGMSDGFETVHDLLELAFVDGARGPEVSLPFLRGVEAMGFDTHPIFSLLQEACYAQGEATRWAAQRVLDARADFDDDADPLLLVGEAIFPWMFEEYAALRPFAAVAHRLAALDDWPPLYDAAQLARNEVPVAAAIYANDMYVERTFSEETATRIRGARTWLTDEFEHNGLRADVRVFARLLEMVRGGA